MTAKHSKTSNPGRKTGPELTHFIQSFLNYSLALVVKGRRRHVQQQDPGIPDQSTSDGDALLLTTAHLAPALADQGVEFLSNFERFKMIRLALIIHLFYFAYQSAETATCGRSMMNL